MFKKIFNKIINFFKKLKAKIKEDFIEPNVTIQKFQPMFTTVDNVVHDGVVYGWFIKDRVLCSVPDYLMIDINSDGYMKDKYGTMYPLTNIKSITWNLLEERIVPDVYDRYREFLTAQQSKDIEFLKLHSIEDNINM